jgi:glyoxylase-like metal-dependent hydrolase (beta-lactamase superfamily II)
MKKYSIEQLIVGSLDTNCYLLSETFSKKTLVIDPGGNPEAIIKKIEENGLKVTGILNTHGHADHIKANKEIKEKYKVPILIHEEDAELLTDPELNGATLIGSHIVSPKADVLLKDRQIVKIGSLEAKVIHTPGHTPGGINLMLEDILFTGDTLFMGSIGRWDFPGGDGKTLLKSLEFYKKLPENITIFPGHGPESTMATELQANPFLAGEKY